MFEPYGIVTSAKVMYEDDKNLKSRGFGFVAFENPEAAEQAVNDMNNKTIDGRNLYVGRAQKKTERQTELRRKFEMLKQERVHRFTGVNLYVKNLDDTIDDERLRKEFSGFGKFSMKFQIVCNFSICNNITDSQKKSTSLHESQYKILWFNFCGRGQNVFFCL